MVAALTDFQVGVVPGRELDAGNAKSIGHQIHKGIMRLGQVQMHRIHHFLCGMRTRDSQYARVHLAHQITATIASFGAKATCHDNLAVFGQRFAYGVQAFSDRIINEATGIDDD
ncbi:hypothetical protein IWX86_002546 [Polaromonas sp. CG_9.2]|nr:hypothetical protein [Polaromonas sp. CG_9.2]